MLRILCILLGRHRPAVSVASWRDERAVVESRCSRCGRYDGSLVEHAQRLALRARDRALVEHPHLADQPERTVEPAPHLPGEIVAIEARAVRLHLDDEHVECAGALETQLVVRREAVEREQRRLDLRGEDVDPAHDEHVVRAALDPADPRERAAARAGLA